MQWVAHRVNTVAELKNIPREYGVEVDLRDQGTRLILQHDPFKDGEDFEDYLKAYEHGLLILNIKSERIEERVLELVKQYKVREYFLLDSSFPMMYALSQKGIKDVAVRYSEMEGVDTVLNMKGHIKWVWVDCFRRFPLTKENYTLFKKAGYNLCLVSPELQGRPEEIKIYKEQMKNQGIVFDAICTKLKNIDVWKS
jgi:hypothetical protein